MEAEKLRLQDINYRTWGPYVSNRQWGNVREDYSFDGNTWEATGHDDAESRTYRWAEEGIAGISDEDQLLCFAFSFWNKKDKMVKERFFGLSNYQGNHGEDIKEIFYYLDNTPTHSYMKMVYKYPQNPFPYDELINVNAQRSNKEQEYELIDTGIFDNNEYFDIFIEYAKIHHDDILIRVSITNRNSVKAPLVILPTLWYRNNWSWGYNQYKPDLTTNHRGQIDIFHNRLDVKKLYSRDKDAKILFCENETNTERLFGKKSTNKYFKDGINNHIVHKKNTVNPKKSGTKAAFVIDTEIEAGETKTFDFRLSPHKMENAFFDFDEIFEIRKNEANEFYAEIQKDITEEDEKNVQRQAFAGLL